MKVAPHARYSRWQYLITPSLIASTLGILAINQPLLLAQIVPDATLPSPSIVPIGCTNCTITGGTQTGSSLFHSFSQFSVPTGGRAFFDNAATVQNIFARVTGSTASTIDGRLQANGTANLFLLNPNGLTFGANATLQLGGSFIGSTAQSIQFQDGSTFSAVNPANPLLTISVPIGLQYGANPGAIQVNGPGNNLSFGSGFSINRATRPAGLQVAPGQTLALVGGDLNLSGGNLTASGGRVELGSVKGAQSVSLTPTNPGWTIGYSNTNIFGDIRLSQAASVDTSSSVTGNGAINIRGRSLQILDGSSLLAITLGQGQGQPVTVQTTDTIQVNGFKGTTASNIFASTILTDAGAAAAATAKGGDIRLQTGTLQAINGGIISASTLAAGAAGNVSVNAQQVNLSGEIPAISAQSGIFSQVLNRTARGNAGTVTINTEQLNMSAGAQINTATSGFGKGGLLQVTAQTVNLSGTGVSRPSGLFARAAGGDGGSIQLATNQLNLTGGAQINSSTIGPGNGGLINIQANNMQISGGATIGPSGIFSSVSGSGSGSAGEIRLSGDQLRVDGGAQIATATSWSGKAGDIFVNVRQVELVGGTPPNIGGLISTSVLQLPPPNTPVRPPATTGAGGTITVNADRLVVRDGAVINVSNFPTSAQSTAQPGNGPVGNIVIQANSVLLDRQGTLTANSRGGDRGNIVINSNENVTLRNGSRITSNASGSATGGNIQITTPFLIGPALENSDITANATNNFGGRVVINANNVLGIRPSPQLTPQSDITASSALGVEFNGEIDINALNVDPGQGVAELPGYLLDRAQQIAKTCGVNQTSRFVVTGRGGIALQPTEQIHTALTWQDWRNPEATAKAVPIATNQVRAAAKPIAQISDAPPLMEATEWRRDDQGQVQLVAPETVSVSPESSIICAAAPN